MIGQTLNQRYQIFANIGRGATGIVYRAHAIDTQQDVAIKILTAELTFDPAMLERFRREGEALKQLRHPNIVNSIDTFEHNGQQVIVMEYVAGGSLHDRLKQGPLPIDQVRRLALGLCDALIRTHDLNIIHRDLKPENVLLTEDGTPKLTDFGIAKLVTEGTRLTGTGAQLGTPYYMSPEAWQGRPLTVQADIWSLGIVLFEILAGQVPFGGDTLAAVMNKVLTAPLPDLRDLRPDTPPALVKIIRRMLARDPAKRYQTMREVALDIERLPTSPGANTVPGAAQATRLKPPEPPAPSRQRWLWVGAGMLLALGLCIAATFGGLWAVGAGSADLRPAGLAWLIGTPSPTPTATPVPTAPPTLPVPTSTATLTLTPPPTTTATHTSSPTATLSPTPTSTATSAPRDNPVSLGNAAQDSIQNQFPGFPTGNQVLGGVWFSIPAQKNQAGTQCGAPYDSWPTAIVIPTAGIARPEVIYVLINAGYTANFAGQTIGSIRVKFTDGRALSFGLILGQTLREWKIQAEENVVRTASGTREIYRGTSAGGSVGVVDMLALPIPAEYRTGTLQSIAFYDTTADTLGSLNPCFFVVGVTVRSRP